MSKTIETFRAGDLFLPLPRPEYMAFPEGFLSALAWKALGVDAYPKAAGDKKIGLRFLSDESNQNAKSVQFFQTMPTGEAQRRLSQALERYGLEEIGNKHLLAEAVLESIKGTVPSKSRFIPASPLSPALALLQNPIGLVGKANPADFANILETIYALGKNDEAKVSVSGMWLRASEPALSMTHYCAP